MTKLQWSVVRSKTKPSLELELRLGIEALWVLPLPGSEWESALLPSNILVGSDGSVSIGTENANESGASQRYLAPEVQNGGDCSLLSAIYSVGALLFEATTGRSFESTGSVQAELVRRRATEPGATKSRWLIPLLEVLAKATHESPEARWRTPEAFSRELARVAAHRIATRDALGALIERVSHDAPREPRQGFATLRGMAVDLSRYPDAAKNHPEPTASLAVVILVAALVVIPTITRSGLPTREMPSAEDRSPLIQGSSPEASRDVPSSPKGTSGPPTTEPERGGAAGGCPGCARTIVEPIVEPVVASGEHSAANEASRPAPPPKKQRAPKRGETFDYGI